MDEEEEQEEVYQAAKRTPALDHDQMGWEFPKTQAAKRFRLNPKAEVFIPMSERTKDVNTFAKSSSSDAMVGGSVSEEGNSLKPEDIDQEPEEEEAEEVQQQQQRQEEEEEEKQPPRKKIIGKKKPGKEEKYHYPNYEEKEGEHAKIGDQWINVETVNITHLGHNIEALLKRKSASIIVFQEHNLRKKKGTWDEREAQNCRMDNGMQPK